MSGLIGISSRPPYRAQLATVEGWLDRARKGRLTVVEIGAGFNTPSVIRWPGERIVAQTSGATLVRINRDHADVPQELGDRAVGIGGEADVAVATLLQRAVATAGRST